MLPEKILSKNRYAHHQLLRLAFLAKRVSITVFLWAIINMKPRKVVCGVGINDADYVTRKFETIEVNGKRKKKLFWECPYHRAWKHMLERCYSAKKQESYPTYKGCTASAEWLTFSNFKNWMKSQNFEGNHLDKDLLFEGNKVYSPETCVFVSQLVNSFTVDSGAARGKWLIGVYWDKDRGKFLAQCRNPFTKKRDNLGRYTCELEAHKAWLKRKLELAHELATIQTDKRVAKALIDRYSKPQIIGE